MRILIVKLSSLGDVVHALPVVADIRRAMPDAAIDWVVEPGFAPLLAREHGLAEVIALPLRRWSRTGWWAAWRRGEVTTFVRRLRRERYDAVLELQGLTKAALVARLARGPSYALANRTEGASHEAPARWLATHALRVEPHSHALDRSRELVGQALGIAVGGPPDFGLAGAATGSRPLERDRIVFVHGTSRGDKLWPEANWIELGRRLLAEGDTIALPHADADELARAERLAAALGPGCEVWPAMDLGALVDRMACTGGTVGVDSGPSHIAVALDLPHVQVYNHPTAWRTGPQARHGHRHQASVTGAPVPTVDAVWDAWQRVKLAAHGGAVDR